jgi:hypothetical protein
MFHGSLHATAAPPQRRHITIKVIEAHVVELSQLIGVPFLGRPVVRWLLWHATEQAGKGVLTTSATHTSAAHAAAAAHATAHSSAEATSHSSGAR